MLLLIVYVIVRNLLRRRFFEVRELIRVGNVVMFFFFIYINFKLSEGDVKRIFIRFRIICKKGDFIFKFKLVVFLEIGICRFFYGYF